MEPSKQTKPSEMEENGDDESLVQCEHIGEVAIHVENHPSGNGAKANIEIDNDKSVEYIEGEGGPEMIDDKEPINIGSHADAQGIADDDPVPVEERRPCWARYKRTAWVVRVLIIGALVAVLVVSLTWKPNDTGIYLGSDAKISQAPSLPTDAPTADVPELSACVCRAVASRQWLAHWERKSPVQSG